MQQDKMQVQETDLLHSSTVVHLLDSDSGGNNNELLYYRDRCFLKLINTDLEISTLETYEGYMVLIIGNPFLNPVHFAAIKKLIRLDDKDGFMEWMHGIYTQHSFGKKENLLMRLEYTCRFARNSEGIWRLFLPCPNYYVGGPDQPDRETFSAAGNSLQKWVEGEISKLYHE